MARASPAPKIISRPFIALNGVSGVPFTVRAVLDAAGQTVSDGYLVTAEDGPSTHMDGFATDQDLIRSVI